MTIRNQNKPAIVLYSMEASKAIDAKIRIHIGWLTKLCSVACLLADINSITQCRGIFALKRALWQPRQPHHPSLPRCGVS